MFGRQMILQLTSQWPGRGGSLVTGHPWQPTIADHEMHELLLTYE